MPNTTYRNYVMPTVGADDDDWGDIQNTLFQAVDTDMNAALAGTIRKGIGAAFGAQGATGTLSIALPSGYTAWEIRLSDIRTLADVQVYARLSVDSGSNYITTGYEFIRTDTSAQSGGTVAHEAATSGTSFLLSPLLTAQASDTDTSGDLIIRVSAYTKLTKQTASIVADGQFKNNGGHRAHTRSGGALLGLTTAAPTHIRLGTITGSTTGGFTNVNWAIFGVAGL